MEKEALTEWLKNCRSAVDFFDKKEDILKALGEVTKKGKNK